MKSLKYLSLCSGIEAASMAWEPLGWTPVAFSEIEPFPSAVLAHHWPEVLNMGDMTQYEKWPQSLDPDLLVGGTPCQSFSVAGLRKGLDDPRGNLMLTFAGIAAKYRPKWFVWENVPGVLSSAGGADFASFLGLITGQTVTAPAKGWKTTGFLSGIDSAYGVAWRVLDAQYFGVAQRRRRVFVVGYLGDWRRAAAVLLDRKSLRGNPPPSREKGQSIAGDTSPCLTSSGRGVARTGDTRGQDPVVAVARSSGSDPTLMATLCAKDNEKWGCNQWVREGKAVLVPSPIAVHGTQDPLTNDNLAFPLGRNTGQENAVCIPINDMATRHAGKNGSGADVGKGHGLGIGKETDPMFTLTKGDKHAVAFGGNIARTLSARYDSSPCADRGMDVVACEMQVRRLTPTECERLQGFPDTHTQIPWRGKPADQCPDGPRYKALGNSMAVPCMAWIGRRIQFVNSIPTTEL